MSSDLVDPLPCLTLPTHSLSFSTFTQWFSNGEMLAGVINFFASSKKDTTFQTLIDHLRSRYNLAFVSTNRKRDGTVRKLKLDLVPAVQKSQGKLVIKARRSYIAPRK